MFMNMLWIETAILGATKLAKAMINAFSGISFYKFAKIQTWWSQVLIYENVWHVVQMFLQISCIQDFLQNFE